MGRAWRRRVSYEDVLPTFRHLEDTPTGDDFYHGRNGPLSIRQRTDEELTPSLLGFIEASIATGFKRVYDFNAAEQSGAVAIPSTWWTGYGKAPLWPI
jgi:choline dehydrogenase